MSHFIFIQQISVLNILNTLYNLHFFSSKCRLFHNAIFFGFCITHILNTGCAKIWRKKIRCQKVKLTGISVYNIQGRVRRKIRNMQRIYKEMCLSLRYSSCTNIHSRVYFFSSRNYQWVRRLSIWHWTSLAVPQQVVYSTL